MSNLLEAIIILLNTADFVLEKWDSSLKNRFSILYQLAIVKAFLFFRIIKYNVFAKNMMIIASKTLPSYGNLAVLLVFLITTYCLFGLQIFKDKFEELTPASELHSFHDILTSWISAFNLTTMDDWYSIMILGTTHNEEKWPTILYCISMIYLINYCMYGLLLAIILDGFSKYMTQVE